MFRKSVVIFGIAFFIGLQWLSGAAEVRARPLLPGFGVCGQNQPSDLAVDEAGDVLYVADTANNRVILLSQAFGCEAFVIGIEGDDQGEFMAPQGVAIDSNGFIYVADTGNNRVQSFETIAGLNPGDQIGFGDIFDPLTGLLEPHGLGVDSSDRIYVADTGHSRIVRFSSAGTFIDTIGVEEDGDGQFEGGEFQEPFDVAACPDDAASDLAGSIYVVDRAQENVQVFDAEGTFLFAFGESGSELGQFSSPSGIAVDFQCNVYVSDTGNDRTQMFDAEGAFLELVGLSNAPVGVAVSSFLGQGGASGGLFVASSANNNIDRYEYINYDTDGDGLIDTDGDGLPDLWEEKGIDLDFDGTVDLDLPEANPLRKTIYIEADFTTGQTPFDVPQVPEANDTIDLVIAAFSDAPVENPDGSTGIDLIVERDDQIENDGVGIAFFIDGIDPIVDFPSLDFFFDNIKRDFFGSETQREDSNSANILTAKRLVYHYALFVQSICGQGDFDQAGQPFCAAPAPLGGIAEIFGDDFIVASQSVTSPKNQAFKIMHEFGHNLGLDHGGDVNTGCKPNYLSVMNYAFAAWIPNEDPSLPFDGRLDFSREALDSLDETNLDEGSGIGLQPVGENGELTDYTFWSVDGVDILAGRGDQEIDWNNNGLIETNVGQDLNAFPATGCGSGSGTVLEGYDDWSNLRYNFRASSNFAPAAHLEIVNEELTDEDYFKLEKFWKQFLYNKYTYSAKFVCVAEVGSEGDAVSPGRYRTAINVHNPHSTDVTFLKKAVIARNENEERGQISELVEDQLAADEALSINCKSIAARFDSAPPIGDGFVVLKSNEPLDVVAVYTSRDSVEVEYIEPTVLEPEEERPEPEGERPEPEEERPDLTVRLPEQTRVSCLSSQGSCTHTVTVEIKNLSRVDVNRPFQVEVQTDNGLSTTLDVPSLAGGESQLLPAILGPGDNCYNPDCEVEAIVDSANVVVESDETNNTAERLDRG